MSNPVTRRTTPSRCRINTTGHQLRDCWRQRLRAIHDAFTHRPSGPTSDFRLHGNMRHIVHLDRMHAMNNCLRATQCLLLCLILVGCQRVTEESVVGSYQGQYGDGVDVLTLFPDGRYVHEFDSNANRPANQGNWIFETLHGGGAGVTFEGFQFRSDAKSLKPAGMWHVEVKKRTFSNSMMLCFDPDLGSCFIQRE